MPFEFPPAELMIIGDSLAQGCRSLTVKREFCAQSWAARIAQSQGWHFITPDFPIPVLFDLEDEIRRLDVLQSLHDLRFEGFLHRLRDNLQTWLDDTPRSAFSCFDNLGLSGCLVDDLYTRTARSSANEIAKLAPNGATDYLLTCLQNNTIGDLHLAINGRFTLNPSRALELDDLTPLDWVRLRKPRMLLVQVGHNHGLYQVGSNANVQGSPAESFTASGGDGHQPFFDQWTELGRQLAELPGEVKHVVVSLLPKVGAVSNLRPMGVEREAGYAHSYDPVFSVSKKQLDGATLSAVDEEIRKANDQIWTVLTTAAMATNTKERLALVNVYALFEARDYKNSLDPARRVVVTSAMAVDNRYVEGKLTLFPAIGKTLAAGGLESIDGMHATGCGYADLASETIKVLGLQHDRSGLLSRALAEDTLLGDYPMPLDMVVRLLAILRDLQHFGAMEAAPRAVLTEDVDIATALHLMQQVFTRQDNLRL
jgi:hypothetical protein